VLLIQKGPWPPTNGWFALCSGVSACPLTAWLLKKYGGFEPSGTVRLAAAVLFIVAGRIALAIEGGSLSAKVLERASSDKGGSGDSDMKLSPKSATVHLPLTNLRICILALVFCPIGSICSFAETRESAAPDQFVEAVSNIKMSVAPISCMRRTGAAVAFGGNAGTAFFASSHGAFITPSHVIEGFLPGGTFADCIAAISLTKGGWRQGS